MEYKSPKGTAPYRLSDTNYVNWAYRVEGYLEARDLWEVVAGIDPEPTKPEFFGLDPKADKAWRRWRKKDRKAWHDIVSLCREQDGQSYKPETAKELWDRLHNTKKPEGKTYYRSQLRAFVNYKQGPKESAEQAYTAMKKIQADIAIINPKTPIYDDMLVEVYLGALKEEPYSSIIFRFNNKILRPDINIILRQLKEKELEESMKISPKTVAANAARAGPQQEASQNGKGAGEKTCNRCHRTGHFIANCYSFKTKEGEKLPPNGIPVPPRTAFGKPKASARQANKDLGQPAELSNNQSGTNSDGHMWKAVAMEALASLELPPGCWIVDSGASHHMTPAWENFVEI
ncbi:MAG: hypothetical protein FRX49_13744 [Trebouxia sp. A1-2]|nr:MAG: hypothetical protein FRX49_13744 [Trebouxia sp. A1-2]